jgi:hypothetical protein
MTAPESQPNDPQDNGRRLAEHDSIPVQIESEIDQGTPADWDWRIIGASQPNAAVFHINHSDVTQVKVDVLRPEDSPPDSPFVITQDIPILIIDSLDQLRLLLLLSSSRQGNIAPELRANLLYLSTVLEPRNH